MLNSFLDVDLAGAENVAVLHLDDVGSVWSIEGQAVGVLDEAEQLAVGSVNPCFLYVGEAEDAVAHSDL